MDELLTQPTPQTIAPATTRALAAVVAAVLLGALGVALLWTWTWGLNLAVWSAALVLVAAELRRRSAPVSWHQDAWWLAPALFFAAALAWRDSPWLWAMDVLALGVALSLPFWRDAGDAWRSMRLGQAAAGLMRAAGQAAFGWIPLVTTDVRWSELRSQGAWRGVMAVGTGLALAAPVVLVFGALFMSADAGFQALIEGLVRVSPAELFGKVTLFGVLAWISAGYLRGMLQGPKASTRPAGKRVLGMVEAATVLVLVDALFALFVGLQLPYLFGGDSTVAATRELTYASYARRGFFELATVSALALAMMLALDGATGPRTPKEHRAFGVLTGLMTAFLLVIIASAAHRMFVYQAAYGWTELRVYVLAFEAWMAVTLLWFAWTVVRDRSERFTWGLLLWAFVGLALMHVPNWEGHIVRHNVALAGGKAEDLDFEHLMLMSHDAVPALVAVRPSLPESQRFGAARVLLDRYEGFKQTGWREWSWSRHRAAQAIESDLEALKRDHAMIGSP